MDTARTEEEREYYGLSRRVYSKFAPFYDLVVAPIRRLRRDVVEWTATGPGTRVLDVATGTGEQAIAFARAGCDVVAVDLSPSMLRVAKRKERRANLRFERANAEALPFGAEGFDLACISFALHEMPTSVRRRVLREMARVTRAAGTIVVVDYAVPRQPAWGALVHGFVKLYERDHYEDFVKLDLLELLREAGIEIREEHRAVLDAVRVVIGTRARIRP